MIEGLVLFSLNETHIQAVLTMLRAPEEREELLEWMREASPEPEQIGPSEILKKAMEIEIRHKNLKSEKPKTIGEAIPQREKPDSAEGSALSPLFLRSVRIAPELPMGEYYATLPAVQAIWREHGLNFTKPVTFLVGENGVGKSTLIEAIAVASGFNPEGGTINFNFSTSDSHSTLYRYLKPGRGYRRNKDGFFLRAETFYNAATYLDEIEQSSSHPFGSYGGISLHKQSHGESFLALAENRFSKNGLYLLDEPEAALSPMRLLRLMVTIHELAKGGAQFIISTHSPILMTLPDSDLIQFTEDGLEHTTYRETEHFQITLAYLGNPDRMLRELLK